MAVMTVIVVVVLTYIDEMCDSMSDTLYKDDVSHQFMYHDGGSCTYIY